MSALPQLPLEEEQLSADLSEPTADSLPRAERDDSGLWKHAILMLVLIAAVLIAQLTCYALEMNLSFQAEEMQKSLQESLDSTERLRMEIHRESSLESLERRAQELGFRKAGGDQFVYLK